MADRCGRLTQPRPFLLEILLYASFIGIFTSYSDIAIEVINSFNFIRAKYISSAKNICITKSKLLLKDRQTRAVGFTVYAYTVTLFTR